MPLYLHYDLFHIYILLGIEIMSKFLLETMLLTKKFLNFSGETDYSLAMVMSSYPAEFKLI